MAEKNERKFSKSITIIQLSKELNRLPTAMQSAFAGRILLVNFSRAIPLSLPFYNEKSALLLCRVALIAVSRPREIRFNAAIKHYEAEEPELVSHYGSKALSLPVGQGEMPWLVNALNLALSSNTPEHFLARRLPPYSNYINSLHGQSAETGPYRYDKLLKQASPVEVIAALSQAGKNWSFWREWYQGFLDGNPMDWELQRRVALIPDPIWEAGPEAVAEEIERIRAEWLAEQLPQADRVEFEHAAGHFVSKPIPLNAAELVETTLKQVEFARSVAAKSNCGFNSNSTAWLYIDHTLEQCRDDPNAIEQNLEIAREDIIEGLENDTYAPDAKLSALEQVLERAVTDLRANHPEVAAAWETRIQHHLRVAEADQKQLIVEKATELIAMSDPKLGAEMRLDAKIIADSAGEVQGGAIRRFFGRVAQMRIIVRSAEVVKRIDASSGYKGTRIVQTLQDLVNLITGLFSG